MAADSATPALEVRLRGSAMTALVVSLILLLALSALFLAQLPAPAQLLMASFSLGYGSHAIYRTFWPRWRILHLSGDQIDLIDQAGQRHRGQLHGRVFVSPLFIGLHWKPERKRLPQSLGVFRPQAKPEHFRRLAAHLRASQF